MKFTITFIALLSISTTWGIKVNRKPEDPKDKREAAIGYPTQGHATHSFQAPALGHDETNAISIGAGYSVGGAKPSYSFGGQESGSYQFAQEGQAPSGHSSIQLAPITLQPNHGALVGTDLAQLMSQLSQSLNSGAYSLQPQNGGQQQQYYIGAPEGHQGSLQDISLAQFGQYEQLGQQGQGQVKQAEYLTPNVPSPPSYSAGTKGLSSFSSTGPVLFNPATSQTSQTAVNYASQSGGHNFGAGSSIKSESGHSFPSFATYSGSGHSPAGYSFGSSGNSAPAFSLGSGAGHSAPAFSYGSGAGHAAPAFSHGSSAGHSSPAFSFGSGAGHSSPSFSFGSGSYSSHGGIKNLQNSYLAPGKSSFKPSAFVGSASPNAIHGISGLSGSYNAPSFSGAHSFGGLSQGAGSHGPSFGGSYGGGSSKVLSQSYLPSKESYSSFEGAGASLSPQGHFSSPPGTTYGIPTGHSYGSPSSASHAASSVSPTYYMSSSKHGPSSHSFGEGSQSYKGPSNSHGALSSYSSGNRYSGGPTRYSLSPKDIQGSYSDNVYSYNTIKYSEELKPKVQ